MKIRCFFANETTGARCRMLAKHKRKSGKLGQRVYLVCKKHQKGPVHSKRPPISKKRAAEILNKKKNIHRANVVSKSSIMQRRASRPKVKIASRFTPIGMMRAMAAGVVTDRDLYAVNEMRLNSPSAIRPSRGTKGFGAITVLDATQYMKPTKSRSRFQSRSAAPVRTAPPAMKRGASMAFPTFASMCGCGDY